MSKPPTEIQFDVGYALPRHGLHPNSSDRQLLRATAIHQTTNEGKREVYPEYQQQITIACNGAGGRVGFEINASRAGPLMRDVLPQRSHA
jgi:hypothetical protein